jgi:hypothetical protein
MLTNEVFCIMTIFNLIWQQQPLKQYKKNWNSSFSPPKISSIWLPYFQATQICLWMTIYKWWRSQRCSTKTFFVDGRWYHGEARGLHRKMTVYLFLCTFGRIKSRIALTFWITLVP